MDKKDIIPARQLPALAWAALLPPALGVLPGAAAELAGEGGWLSTLLALPALLPAVWAAARLSREDGLAGGYLRALGRVPGGAVLIIYMVWALALLSVRLRLGGERLLLTARQGGGPWLFMLAAAAMSLWMAWGARGAFGRAAALFFAPLALMLAAVSALAVFQMRAENLLPLWTEDLLPICRSAVPALGTLCGGIYAFFLAGGAAADRGGGRGALWTAGGCLALSAMQLVVLGNFGPALTARLEVPFLTLAKSVGVEGAFQRAESLAGAVLLLGDLTALALLLWACRGICAALWPKMDGRAAAAAALLTALALAAQFPDALSARDFERTWAAAGNLLLGLVLPLAAALLPGRRKKE